jgi:hypothetical protein
MPKLEEILELMNNCVRLLKSRNIHILDIENPEWCMSEIIYDKSRDEVFSKWKEVKYEAKRGTYN